MKTTFLLLLGASAHLLAVDVVAPSINGNVNTAAPFSVPSMRYQQVYDASTFSSLTPVGGGWITALGFRQVSGPVPTINANFQINLSTSSKAVDGLSPSFAANVGSDNRAVFGPDDYQIQYSPNGPVPHGFGLAFIIPLTTPFFYNPANGNLVMDVRMNQNFGGGGGVMEYDASTLPTDTSSAVIASDRDSLTGTTGTFGLITGFRITPGVPEPSSLVLLFAAVVVFSLFGLRKNKQQERKE